jgi:hypothetical protein
MATKYIANMETGTIHKEVDGRVLERCNIDDIEHKRTFNILQLAMAHTDKPKLCKRCFKSGERVEAGVVA